MGAQREVRGPLAARPTPAAKAGTAGNRCRGHAVLGLLGQDAEAARVARESVALARKQGGATPCRQAMLTRTR
eukprot:15459105-Alexandrium_andersonii.AAC.1